MLLQKFEQLLRPSEIRYASFDGSTSLHARRERGAAAGADGRVYRFFASGAASDADGLRIRADGTCTCGSSDDHTAKGA